jgi:O-succinylbenzoic acid--CoA ligase
MPELVALDLPAGQDFVDALQAAWDDGNAVLPLDPRLAKPVAQRLLGALRPTMVVDAAGAHRRAGGLPSDPDDALVIATSGTTGNPKGVVLTHEAVRASALATSARLEVDPGRDRWLACLPLAHIGGLSVVTRALITGTPCTVLRRFDAAEVERQAHSGATLVSLVATALGRMDAGGFRAVLLGGAAPPEDLPANVVTTYGMTETGSGVVYDGRPIEGAEIRIEGTAPEGDEASQMGEVGEVLVRGPMVMRTYRDGADPRRQGGWYPTGDAGLLERDGTLRVFGRITEVIVSGGEKIWPVAVEQLLATLPGVAQVAVWKREDAEWGERVVAWVVPSADAAPPALGDLRERVASELAPWAAPRELVIVSSLPRTPSGKVRRTELT